MFISVRQALKLVSDTSLIRAAWSNCVILFGMLLFMCIFWNNFEFFSFVDVDIVGESFNHSPLLAQKCLHVGVHRLQDNALGDCQGSHNTQCVFFFFYCFSVFFAFFV